MRRLLKQFVYGIIYIAFFSFLGFGVYFLWFRPVASCTNGIKDVNEEGVDCGGVCAYVCMPPGFRELETDIPTVLKPISNQVNVLAKLTNYNLDLGAKTFSYTISLYNDKDVKLESQSGTSFIYPGEIKYIPAFIKTFKSPDVSYAKLEVGNATWVDANKFIKPQLRLQESKTSVASSSVQVSGKIVNDDTYGFSNVQVLVILRGVYGEMEGLTKTELNDVSAGQTVTFSAVHPSVLGIDPQRTEVTIYASR